MAPVLYIVIPCYNEQEVLPITAPMFREKLRTLTEKGKIAEESRILFVNDGSRDRTWEIIEELARSDPHYIGICQSRRHLPEPQPRPPERRAGRAHGGQGPLRHHHLHRL